MTISNHGFCGQCGSQLEGGRNCPQCGYLISGNIYTTVKAEGKSHHQFFHITPLENSPVKTTSTKNKAIYIVISILLIMFISGTTIIYYLTTPSRVLDSFCNNLIRGKYKEADNMLTIRLQREWTIDKFIPSRDKYPEVDSLDINSCTHDIAISNFSSDSTYNVSQSWVRNNIGIITDHGEHWVSLLQDGGRGWKILTWSEGNCNNSSNSFCLL